MYILHDHVVCGDAISCDKEQCLVIDFVQITHFSACNQLQGTLQVSLGKCFSHCVGMCEVVYVFNLSSER